VVAERIGGAAQVGGETLVRDDRHFARV
jgi:hypothetical protein